MYPDMDWISLMRYMVIRNIPVRLKIEPDRRHGKNNLRQSTSRNCIDTLREVV